MNYTDCLDNIISIKDPCVDYSTTALPTSYSGYDLFDLPGISFKKANLIADEDYLTGLNLLNDKRRLAILSIHSELMAVMNANNFRVRTVTDMFNTVGELRSSYVNIGSKLAGIRITNKVYTCSIKKLKIENVYIGVRVETDTEVNLIIKDGATTYTYPITLKAGKTTRIRPGIFITQSECDIYIQNGSALYRLSINPNCGCGSNRSGCAAVTGLLDTTTNTNESYGIWADVVCECDLSTILCALSGNSLLGEIVLYKTGVNILDEGLKTDRLNFFTIYGKEEMKETKIEWENIYREKWNLFIQSLRQSLTNVDRCGCVDCYGLRIAANV